MRRFYQACLVLSSAVLFVLALALPASAGQWLTGSRTNPTTDWVLMQTGTLDGRPAEFTVYLRSTVAVQLAVERLTSGGAAVARDSVTFTLDPGPMTRLDLEIDFDAGDTFRVRVVSGVTGTVQGAMRFNRGYCLQGLGCAR